MTEFAAKETTTIEDEKIASSLGDNTLLEGVGDGNGSSRSSYCGNRGNRLGSSHAKIAVLNNSPLNKPFVGDNITRASAISYALVVLLADLSANSWIQGLCESIAKVGITFAVRRYPVRNAFQVVKIGSWVELQRRLALLEEVGLGIFGVEYQDSAGEEPVLQGLPVQ